MTGPVNVPNQPVQVGHVDLSKTTANPEIRLSDGSTVLLAQVDDASRQSAQRNYAKSAGAGTSNTDYGMDFLESKKYPPHVDKALSDLVTAIKHRQGGANDLLEKILQSSTPLSEFKECFKESIAPTFGLATKDFEKWVLQNAPQAAHDDLKARFKAALSKEYETYRESKSHAYSGPTANLLDLGISLDTLNSLTPYLGELPSAQEMWGKLSSMNNWKGYADENGFMKYFTPTSMHFSEFTVGSGTSTYPMEPLAGVALQKVESGLSQSPGVSKDGAKGHFQFMPQTIDYLRYRAEQQERPWNRSINPNNYDDQIFLLKEYRSWVADELDSIFTANAASPVQPTYGVLLAVDFASHNGGPGAAKYMLSQWYKSGGKTLTIPNPESNNELPNFVGNNINSVLQTHQALTELGYIKMPAADSLGTATNNPQSNNNTQTVPGN